MVNTFFEVIGIAPYVKALGKGTTIEDMYYFENLSHEYRAKSEDAEDSLIKFLLVFTANRVISTIHSGISTSSYNKKLYKKYNLGFQQKYYKSDFQLMANLEFRW